MDSRAKDGYERVERPKMLNNKLAREHLAETGPAVKIGYKVGKNPRVEKKAYATKPESKS